MSNYWTEYIYARGLVDEISLTGNKWKGIELDGYLDWVFYCGGQSEDVRSRLLELKNWIKRIM